MAQQPNIELQPEDGPRPVPEPDPPRRWRPSMRPGMITSPDQRPTGPAFGHPGPDTGYALKLIAAADLPERSDELEGVLAALMGARSSHYGRAPVVEDLEVAKVLCGFGDGAPEWVADRRERWLRAAAHEKPVGRTALADVDPDLLRETPDRIRYALAHQTDS